MSQQPLRRSARFTPIRAHYMCSRCSKRVIPWEVRPDRFHGMNYNQGRCPDCNHINNANMRLNYQNTGAATVFCICPCLCNDADHQGDSDYVPDVTEQEDVLENRIDPVFEPIFTGAYGVEVNAVANSNTDQARLLYVEGHGHHAVATQHDIGIPAESSLVNNENQITSIEANSLRSEIQPWEADALLHNTGRPWQELQRSFPEMMDMGNEQVRTNNQDQRNRNFHVACPHCYKFTSDAWLEWLRSGTMSICNMCQKTKKPQDPMDDPDWQGDGWRQNMQESMRVCMCRCVCDGPDTRQTDDDLRVVLRMDEEGNAHVGPPPEPTTPRHRSMVDSVPDEQQDGQEEYEDEEEEEEEEQQNNQEDMDPLPDLPMFQTLDPPTADRFTTLESYRQYLADEYDVAALVLSHNSNSAEEMLADSIRLVYQAAHDDFEFTDYDQTYRYCYLGLEMCRAVPRGIVDMSEVIPQFIRMLEAVMPFFQRPAGATRDNLSALMFHFLAQAQQT